MLIDNMDALTSPQNPSSSFYNFNQQNLFELIQTIYGVFFQKKKNKSILRSCFHQEKQTKTIRWINCACTYYRIMSICALMYKHKQSWCSLLYWNVFIPCLLQSIRALLVCTWACVPGTPNRSHSRVCNTDLPLNVSLSALSAN